MKPNVSQRREPGDVGALLTARRLVVICRGSFYLLLALVVFFDLLDTGVRYGQSLLVADPLAGEPPLDSFSKPSIAVAVLKREGEDLFSTFSELRNNADYPVTARPLEARPTVGAGVPFDAGFSTIPKAMASIEIPAVQRLEKLHRTYQDLQRDLDQKLLVVYLKNQDPNRLVDCFLELLYNSPDRPEVLEWVVCALDCAKFLGRTNEVEDALKHVLRFNARLPTAPGLKDRIERWRMAASQEPE